MNESTSTRPAGRPRRTRWRDALAGSTWLLGAVPVLAVAGLLLWQQTRPQSLQARICARLYAAARTASDTAAADWAPTGTRTQPGRTCGDLRAGGEIPPRR